MASGTPSAETLTLVPNDRWWGEKPLLDRIIWREMGDEAERAAFKNGELDSIGFAGLATYNAVKGQPVFRFAPARALA